MKKLAWGVAAIAAVALAVGVLLRLDFERSALSPTDADAEVEAADESDDGTVDEVESGEAEDDASGADETDDGEEEDEAEEQEEPQTEEEKREAEEEAKVDAFDNLTDKWMEPSEKGVTMAEVDNFAKQFRQVPKDRKDECIHRALNLIPDENVMLLAGVLMDKTMDKEIVETVYNDILNRDEDVKKPILLEIFKDKSHPCWADTAWILDVTGELPKAK